MERLLWLAVTLLSSVVAALVAVIVTISAGGGPADAVTAGAVTFAGAEGLLLAILGFALTNGRHGP